MNELMWISGVHVYTDEMGTAYLNLEDVARGLGFIETSGDYIRWQRVEGYLNDLKLSTGGERPKFIPENVFSYLAELKFSQQVAMAIKSKSKQTTAPLSLFVGMKADVHLSGDMSHVPIYPPPVPKAKRLNYLH